jgi:hypothetical protein
LYDYALADLAMVIVSVTFVLYICLQCDFSKSDIFFVLKPPIEASIVVHPYNPGMQETEAGGL